MDKSVDINKPISSNVKEIADKIAKYNGITSEFIGIAGSKSKSWEYYEKLSDEAEDYELLKLIDYPNPAVRCYAFFSLVDREYKDIFPVLKFLIQDTREVSSQAGCIEELEFVADAAYRHWRQSKIKLTQSEQDVLDSIIIFSNVRLWARANLFNNIENNEKYYSRVRDLYIKTKDLGPFMKEYGALKYISKFKKEEDIDLILASLPGVDQYTYDSEGLEGIKNFPHPKFFSYLKELHKKAINRRDFKCQGTRKLYQAIVQYKNSESETIIREAVTFANENLRRCFLACLWLALEKYPDKIYEDIQKKIEISDKMKDKALKIDNNDTDYLWDIDE